VAKRIDTKRSGDVTTGGRRTDVPIDVVQPDAPAVPVAPEAPVVQEPVVQQAPAPVEAPTRPRAPRPSQVVQQQAAVAPRPVKSAGSARPKTDSRKTKLDEGIVAGLEAAGAKNAREILSGQTYTDVTNDPAYGTNPYAVAAPEPIVTLGDKVVNNKKYRDSQKDVLFEERQAAEQAQYLENENEKAARAHEVEMGTLETLRPVKKAKKVAPAPVVETAVEAKPVVALREETPAVPNPESKPRIPLPATPFPATQSALVDRAKSALGKTGTGSAIEAPIEGNPRLAFRDVSLPAELLFRAVQSPDSAFRRMFIEAGFIEMQLADPAYFIPKVVDLLSDDTERPVYTEKRPVVDEASAHSRNLRAHLGSLFIQLNPLVANKYNADFDGDAMKVSADSEAIAGVKSAMDFLVDTNGVGKIDFGIANWGNVVETTEMLRKIFITQSGMPIILSERGLAGIAKALVTASRGDPDVRGSVADPDAGFRSLMMWIRSEGESYPQAPDVMTDLILQRIFNNNKMIRTMEQAILGLVDWRFDQIPQATGARPTPAFTSTLAPFPDLISESSLPASDSDVAMMRGHSTGAIESRAQRFRRGADDVREGKKRPDLFGDPRSADLTVPFEDAYATIMNGVDHLDDSVNNITSLVRRLIYAEMGAPDISSPEAFQKWLGGWGDCYNRIVFNFNQAAARVKFDMTLMPYDDLLLPIIPPGDTPASRKILCNQFRRAYAGVKTTVLFGEKEPLLRGCKNLTLEEFILTHNLRSTGNKNMLLNTVPNFIMRLADLRTSYARDFDTLMQESLQAMMTENGKMTKFYEMAVRRKNLGDTAISLDQDVTILAQAIHTMSPDLFDFVGLNSPEAFATDPLGLRMSKANSSEKLGGLLYEAQVMYRWASITKWEQRLAEAGGNGKRRAKAELKIEHELDALASSSSTWATLVSQHRGGTDIFSTPLFANETKAWKDHAIWELVVDPRNPVGRPMMQEYEVASELWAHPKGQYSTNRWGTNLGHKTQREALKQAKKKADNYAESSWDHCATQVADAHAQHLEGAFTAFLNAIRPPGTLNSVAPWAMVDGMLSILESSQKSAEKPRQEDEVSYLYSAVCGLVNGDIHSDLEIGGDLALGGVADDRFQTRPDLLARILSDPTFTIDAYAGSTSGPVNRAVFFKDAVDPNNPTEAEMVGWLLGHPRAAMALREHAMNNSVDAAGFSTRTATRSLSDTIALVLSKKNDENYENDLVLSAMTDHPGFYAMVGLATRITGMKRSQLRKPAIDTLYDVVRLLRSLSMEDGSEFDMLDYVRQIATAQLGAERMAEIDKIHALGQEQEAAGIPRDAAPSEDVRAMEEYHLAEMFESLAFDLERYVRVVTDMKLSPIEAEDATTWSELFKFKDDGATRSYVAVIERLLPAKVAISTSMNGAESRRHGALQPLSAYVAPACDAEAPPVIDVVTFRKDWRKLKLAGRKVTIDAVAGVYIAVSEVTVEKLIELFPAGIPVEVPAACTSLTCACGKHATADPSTNMRGNQTPSLGRFLTIVRAESGEGLNLQAKGKVGSDRSDSISKNRVYDFIADGALVQAEVQRVFDEEGLPAARVWLANELDRSFRKMKYGNQMSIDDYTNVAQVLIRLVETEAGVRIRVLRVGELSAIVKQAIQKDTNASKAGRLDFDQQLAASIKGLLAVGIGGDLDVEALLAGMRVAGQSRFPNLEPGIPARRSASIGRNAAFMNQIVAENPQIKPHSDAELDGWEAELRSNPATAGIFGRWPKYLLGPKSVQKPGTSRYTYRLVGGIGATGKSFGHQAVGFRNAWAIDIRNPRAAEVIAMAYRLGLTTLLEGDLEQADFAALWKDVYERTGAIDANQIVNLPDAPGLPERSMLRMFDIRLNGGNTTIDNGALNASVVHMMPENIGFFVEDPLNVFDLGESEIAICQTYADNKKVNITGDHHIPARVAFAQMFDAIGTPAQADLDVSGFFLRYRFLSNFWGADGKGEAPLEIELDGVIYPSVENAYQAAKTLDLAKRAYFETCSSYDAKQEGKKLTRRPGWEKMKVKVMGALVRQKFAPGSELAAMLLATGEGYLEEKTRWPNPFWGVGPTGGSNVLGKGLMTVRDEIRPPGWKPRVIGRDNVEVRLPTLEEIDTEVTDLYVKDTTEDAPDEFDRLMRIDIGVPRVEGSPADIQLREGVRRFVSRRAELKSNGLLPTGRPGEIIGFLRAQNGNDVRLFPIRPFEEGHAAGAPASLEISRARYDTDAEELVIDWEHTGTMLGRAFKLLEAGMASEKTVARSIAYPDIAMKNGLLISGVKLSAVSRRLDLRMKQKMVAVMFIARLNPYGYNLAERTEAFPNPQNREDLANLKAGLLDSTATLGSWKALLDPKGDASFDGRIDFFPVSMTSMNDFCNLIAVKAVRYGINPTVVFASRHLQDGVMTPSNMWFDFRILFNDGPWFLESFMNYMNLILPSLVPAQDYTGTGQFSNSKQDTFFNKDLQVLIPFSFTDEDGHTVSGEYWVDMFAGPHFADEHFSGYQGSGTTVMPDGLTSMWASIAGGRKPNPVRAKLYSDWMGVLPGGIRAESHYDED
jgi:ribA/ribD-fused uncharacterized protein